MKSIHLKQLVPILILILFSAVAARPVFALPGSFEFSAQTYSVAEGEGSVAITINRIGGSDGVVTVQWRTLGVSATYDADYNSFSWTTLTFADGETSKTLLIGIVPDAMVEGDETFRVLLDYPTGGATLGSDTTATVTILDDDGPGSFEFSAVTYSVQEGAGAVAVTINRVGGSNGTVTVQWRTLGVSATYDADYDSFSWTTLTFADGETSKTRLIGIVPDTLLEGDETFRVLLDYPTGGATLGSDTTATVTILDDDSYSPGSFEFSPVTYSVEEGAGAATVTINRVGGSNGAVTVQWRTLGVSATYDADYNSFSWTTLTFADGETSKTEMIGIVSDAVIEGDETFQVLLDYPTGGATLGSDTTATVTILDDDNYSPGSFEFSSITYPVEENAGAVTVTINRVGGSSGAVTVQWRTLGVSATYDADYGSFSWTTLTFADGETSKTQMIGIVSDTLAEGDETFRVLLGYPTGGATLGSDTTATVTIADDDDSAGSFEFFTDTYSVTEETSAVAITINRVGGSRGDVTVQWRTLAGSASHMWDYRSFSWTPLSFTDGETSKTELIFIPADDQVEGDETFQVLLGYPTGGATLGTPTTATVTIIDDDGGTQVSYCSPDRSWECLLDEMVGFAEAAGTTGGAGGDVCWVSNRFDAGSGSLRDCAGRLGSKWIRFNVAGTINLTSPLFLTSNTTIDGRDNAVRIAVFGLRLHAIDNVIINDIELRGGLSEVGDHSFANNAIQISLGSSRIWVDHVSMAAWPDDLLGIGHGSSNITLSWSHLYVNGTGRNFGILVGNSPDQWEDTNIRFTMHHNFFDGLDQRMPRIRYAEVHSFNNFFRAWNDYATWASQQSEVISERNIYDAVTDIDALNTAAEGSDPYPGEAQDVESCLTGGAIVRERNPDVLFRPSFYYDYQSEQCGDALRNSIANGVGPRG